MGGVTPNSRAQVFCLGINSATAFFLCFACRKYWDHSTQGIIDFKTHLVDVHGFVDADV